MEGWGERLDQALRSRKVPKLYALAVEIGVDESAISRWRKSQPISLANAIALCRTLDVSLDWLVMGRGTMDGHRSYEPASFASAVEVLFRRLDPRDARVVRRAAVIMAGRQTSRR